MAPTIMLPFFVAEMAMTRSEAGIHVRDGLECLYVADCLGMSVREARLRKSRLML